MLLNILMSLEFENGPVAKKAKALYRKFYDGLNELRVTRHVALQ